MLTCWRALRAPGGAAPPRSPAHARASPASSMGSCRSRRAAASRCARARRRRPHSHCAGECASFVSGTARLRRAREAAHRGSPPRRDRVAAWGEHVQRAGNTLPLPLAPHQHRERRAARSFATAAAKQYVTERSTMIITYCSSGCSRSRRPPTTSPPTASTCSDARGPAGLLRGERTLFYRIATIAGQGLAGREWREGIQEHGRRPGAGVVDRDGSAVAVLFFGFGIWHRFVLPATGHRSAGIRATDPTVPR